MARPSPPEIKQSLIASGEEWSPAWQAVLDLSPSYAFAYLNLRLVPLKKQHLLRKIQELILLAMDAQVTHLFRPGIALHTAAALKAGATQAEVLETLQLASVLGVHSVTVGVELLSEVLAEKNLSLPEALTPEQQKLKDSFVEQRGYWAEAWDPVLRLSPEFFTAYTAYSSVPFAPGNSVLEPKVKELVYCAIDCATTHLFGPGLKIHIRNAIEKGATKEEVMEVFELAALMGVQTVVYGAEALAGNLKGSQK